MYFACINHFFTYIHTLCLTTTRWSWGCKTRRLFCSFPDENEESFYDCSPRVRYKSRVNSWEKITLATTLCTWSPNEVAHCLVSLVVYPVHVYNLHVYFCVNLCQHPLCILQFISKGKIKRVPCCLRGHRRTICPCCPPGHKTDQIGHNFWPIWVYMLEIALDLD
jgi:hypothetical protein